MSACAKLRKGWVLPSSLPEHDCSEPERIGRPAASAIPIQNSVRWIHENDARHQRPVDALAFVDALRAAQGVHLASLGPKWPRLRQLCIEKQLEGNAVPDAWLAAATIHLGEHLVSFNRDFRRLIGRSQFTLLEADAG
jgi:predicted nucleic acid-binding protein